MTDTIHLVLADDDPDDCFVFSRCADMVSPKIRFTCLNDCETLLKYLDQHPLPDVLFLDLNMPALSGQECMKKIKGRLDWKDLPIVIYSTASNPDIIDECYKLGANLYIIKPTDPVQIKDTIDWIISKFVRGSN